MAFTIPTLLEIKQRLKTDIDSSVGVTGTSLRRSVTGALSRAFAGALFSLYGFLSFIFLQLIIDTATGVYLERWAAIFGIFRQEASFAQGSIKFTGTDTTVIPAGTELKIDDQTFETISSVTIVSGEAIVDVLAQKAGVGGNIDSGQNLTLISSIPGINSKAEIQAGGINGGSDPENDDSLRDRLLSRLRSAPMGGAANDYIVWAKEVDSSVTRAWVYPAYLGQDNSVGVTFVQDQNDPIIPNASSVAEVQSYIDDPSRKPLTAEVTVFPPTPKDMDMQIQLKPNTLAVQSAVTASLQELIQREAEPGGALLAVNNGTILLSRIREAISNADGESDHVIDLINGVAPANVTANTGEMIKLGTITWLTLP